MARHVEKRMCNWLKTLPISHLYISEPLLSHSRYDEYTPNGSHACQHAALRYLTGPSASFVYLARWGASFRCIISRSYCCLYKSARLLFSFPLASTSFLFIVSHAKDNIFTHETCWRPVRLSKASTSASILASGAELGIASDQGVKTTACRL
jgi:hypothetical protein